jgi:hypothetical protein
MWPMASTILPGTGLFVQLSPTFAPAVGQVFTFIRNNGPTSTTGIFQNLPEGAVLTLGIYEFRLSYMGGAGQRDVTLTCTFAPQHVDRRREQQVVGCRQLDGGRAGCGNPD